MSDDFDRSIDLEFLLDVLKLPWLQPRVDLDPFPKTIQYTVVGLGPVEIDWVVPPDNFEDIIPPAIGHGTRSVENSLESGIVGEDGDYIFHRRRRIATPVEVEDLEERNEWNSLFYRGVAKYESSFAVLLIVNVVEEL